MLHLSAQTWSMMVIWAPESTKAFRGCPLTLQLDVEHGHLGQARRLFYGYGHVLLDVLLPDLLLDLGLGLQIERVSREEAQPLLLSAPFSFAAPSGPGRNSPGFTEQRRLGQGCALQQGQVMRADSSIPGPAPTCPALDPGLPSPPPEP